MKQEYGSSPLEIPEILTNEKKGSLEVLVSPVDFYGPGGWGTIQQEGHHRKFLTQIRVGNCKFFLTKTLLFFLNR
jgi:hypothetical protein